MKKFIFSLILVVSTLFSFGQSNMHGFTLNSTLSVMDVSNILYTKVSTTNVTPHILSTLDTNLNLTQDVIVSYDVYEINNSTTFSMVNDVILPISASAFTTIIDTAYDGILSINIDQTNSILRFKNFKIIDVVGIKNLEQRQLNLFTYSNKIKVNGQIDEKLKLNVFNILGQLVIQTDLKNEIETNVATGVYILQVLDEHDNSIETKKVLLQN